MFPAKEANNVLIYGLDTIIISKGINEDKIIIYSTSNQHKGVNRFFWRDV